MKDCIFSCPNQQAFSFSQVPGTKFRCVRKNGLYAEKPYQFLGFDGPFLHRFKIGSIYSRKDITNVLACYRMQSKRYKVDFIGSDLPPSPKINPENKRNFVVYVWDYYNDDQTIDFIIEE